jgi:hypothetical protein
MPVTALRRGRARAVARSPLFSFASILVVALSAAGCADEVTLGDDAGGDRARDLGRGDASDAAGDSGRWDVGSTDLGLGDLGGGGGDGGSGSADVLEPSADAEVVIVGNAASLPAAFDAATPGVGVGPELLYPLDGSLMPRNISPATFQWDGPDGTPYRLVVRTPSFDVVVYTTGWQWTPPASLWERIASDRGEPARIWVERLDGSTRSAGRVSELSFSAAAVRGAIYFWAPLSSGIVRLELDSATPEPFLTGDVFRCVGCHGLSPDGSRLAYTRSSGGTPIGNLGVIGTDAARTEYMAPTSLAAYYPSFGPDNVRLAATRGREIVIVNTDTGAVEEALPRPGSAAANYAAWSPRGDSIAFSAGTADPLGGLGISDAGIARVRLLGDGTWSAAEWLARPGDAGGTPENFFYPAYSPDSRWLVFNRATEAASVGASPVGSELWLLSNERGGPVRLDAANGPPGTTNSWPKWAPDSSDGTLWVAFTSSQPYGRLHQGQSQIWIAGIDPARAARGEDPSFAPFWMPHQSLTETNHVAYWANFTKE